MAILEFEDAIVGDGDTKDVRGEIFESGCTRANGQTMNDPIFEPDLLVEEVEEVSLFELIAEFGAEEDREWFNVNEEILARVEPLTIGRESASGGDEMDVRMIEEVTGPGMEETNHAYTSADEARVCGQFE